MGFRFESGMSDSNRESLVKIHVIMLIVVLLYDNVL